MVTIGKVPFLYLERDNMSNDDLKTLCQELEKTASGFYFIVSKDTSSSASSFLGYVSKQYQATVNAKACFEAIKQANPDLRGGGSPAMVQGSGSFKERLKEFIVQWLQQQ
jgi:alanyl-tRNA synthetase